MYVCIVYCGSINYCTFFLIRLFVHQLCKCTFMRFYHSFCHLLIIILHHPNVPFTTEQNCRLRILKEELMIVTQWIISLSQIVLSNFISHVYINLFNGISTRFNLCEVCRIGPLLLLCQSGEIKRLCLGHGRRCYFQI